MSTPVEISKTPEPPYYAVIFTSTRTEGDQGYDQMSKRMVELGSQYDGFLGIESARGANGFGITVSYWRDEECIRKWKRDPAHEKAQQGGKQSWYADHHVRIAKVERVYGKPTE
jgi:heme-degrading monooxygenase HmoA